MVVIDEVLPVALNESTAWPERPELPSGNVSKLNPGCPPIEVSPLGGLSWNEKPVRVVLSGVAQSSAMPMHAGRVSR